MESGVSHVNPIKAINVDTVHKICSGQVVLSLAVAVKELVENSLDAGATNIDVRLKNYGLDLIEVSDNGTGVMEHNFAALTLKYHTSKLNEYSDLLDVTSFGFRGEALSSLCALAKLTITTRHLSSDYATKLEYDHKGNITNKTPCARQVGTTVTLTNLFNTLPVRQKEFQKNAKREFNKMTNLLYAYCLISTGVKITCTNQTSNNSKSVVVATQGSTSYKDNLACIFGVKQMQSIMELKTECVSNIKDNIFKGLSGTAADCEESVNIEDVEIDLSEDSNEAAQTNITDNLPNSQKSQGYKNATCPVEIVGFISSCAHGSGRSSTDRQFYYVNSRPCEPMKIIKLVNEVYRQHNPNQYPFVFMNINLERTSVDVNVTPDKRKVFLTKEKAIMDVVKASLMKLFESIPRILKVESLSNSYNHISEVKAELDQPRIFNSFMKQFSNNKQTESGTNSDNSRDVKPVELKRKSTTLLDFVSLKARRTNDINESIDTTREIQTVSDTEDFKDMENTHKEVANKSDSSNELHNDTMENNHKSITSTPPGCHLNQENIMYLAGADLLNTQIRSISEVVQEQAHTIYCKTKKTPSKAVLSANKEPRAIRNKEHKVVTDRTDLGRSKRKSVNLKTSLDHVKVLSDMYHKNKNRAAPERIKFKSAINPVFNKKCEEELSREITKESFKQMDVIGQFNLGFIITRLEDDLFIIDQHATDEIYNFETLQKTTELTHQKLVIPQQLELTGVNEQILMDNLEVFKKNGFTFDIDVNAPPTKRVKLLTIPMSKNWIFGKEDIEELLFMLRESQSEHCRPSRVRAMFASRACRKSVMIGTALAKSDMKKLVDHMAEIDKPWNCPHGRPTIRHLVNLAMIHKAEN